MEIWWYGSMVIWRYGDIEVWWYGNMVIWWYMVYGDIVSCPDPASFNGGIGSGHFWPKARS